MKQRGTKMIHIFFSLALVEPVRLFLWCRCDAWHRGGVPDSVADHATTDWFGYPGSHGSDTGRYVAVVARSFTLSWVDASSDLWTVWPPTARLTGAAKQVHQIDIVKVCLAQPTSHQPSTFQKPLPCIAEKTHQEMSPCSVSRDLDILPHVMV